jgi:HEAT repeat protein
MRFLGAAIRMLMLVAAACVPAAAQDLARPDLRQALSDIAAHRRAIGRGELSDALRQGLSSADPGLRQRALLAIASRAGGPRFGESDTVNQEWRDDRAAIMDLRPLVVAAALGDQTHDVRRAAVFALGNMDFDLDRPHNKQLSGRLVADLAKVYNGDVNGRVRTEIVKALALSSNDSQEVREIITSALDDREAGARQFAAKAVGRLRHPEYLEKLVSMLQVDGDKSVRVSVAMAVAAYGAAAAPYRAQLQGSRERETDRDVQSAIDHAVKALDKRR